MDNLYLIFKWLHILLAIIAIGANATYGVWLARAARSPEALPFTLRGVKIIDDRIANPAYGLLLVTGLINVFVGNWSLTTPWILAALVLYVLLVLLGLAGYTPTLRRQINLVETVGPAAPEYRALAGRATVLGIVLAVIAVAIVFLMVVKPNFGL
jgi:uncharacterized membrane protein